MARSGFIILDKPQGITSQGAVSRVKRALDERRVGHGGTLDPLATGVLPIFVGRATRASSLMLEADKAYRAGFLLGHATDTRDITGTPIAESAKTASEEEVIEVLQRFVGRGLQSPPMYSAVKVGGKKLYELARKGIEVERAPREIEIYSICYAGQENGEHTIDVACSKGTYIRELVHDIGIALGTYATMTALRRIRTGSFDISAAVPIDELTPADLRPTDELFNYPKVRVDENGERLIRVGAAVPADCLERERADFGSELRVYAQSGDFLCVAAFDGTTLTTIKSFFEV